MRRHVAFKCTYNDGGEGALVGFSEVCTDVNIAKNINSGHVWCSERNCVCRQRYDRRFKGARPSVMADWEPCYESHLFRGSAWQFGCGMYHHGRRRGQPIPVTGITPGAIALLTTRFPGDAEGDRKIIGLFEVEKVLRKPGESVKVVGSRKRGLRLPLEEARDLFYWDYVTTSAGARWNTGLFRYVSDESVACILRNLNETMRDAAGRKVVQLLLQKPELKAAARTIPGGARGEQPPERRRRVLKRRKYGSGGEGPDHKRFKEWLAKNPGAVGVVGGTPDGECEHPYLCGDMVDILFRSPGGRYTVVEVETDFPEPGWHQALKYRVLQCAQLGLPVDSPRVTAVLASHVMPASVRERCVHYGIRCVQIDRSAVSE